MTTLTLGADRDQLCLRLDRAGTSTEQRHRAPVLERNDHQLVSDFLREHGCEWSSIDRFRLLAVPHSKTTVRVNATLLATAAWYFNRSLTVIPVDSLDDAIEDVSTATAESDFDASVLGQLS